MTRRLKLAVAVTLVCLPLNFFWNYLYFWGGKH